MRRAASVGAELVATDLSFIVETVLGLGSQEMTTACDVTLKSELCPHDRGGWRPTVVAGAAAENPLDEADFFPQVFHCALAGTFDPAAFGLGGCDACDE